MNRKNTKESRICLRQPLNQNGISNEKVWKKYIYNLTSEALVMVFRFNSLLCDRFLGCLEGTPLKFSYYKISVGRVHIQAFWMRFTLPKWNCLQCRGRIQIQMQACECKSESQLLYRKHHSAALFTFTIL